jgi:hypothetical protein
MEPVCVSFTETDMTVALADGRRITTPLDWYPKLAAANADARAAVSFSPFGLHWDDLDEDLSVVGMLEGRPAR